MGRKEELNGSGLVYRLPVSPLHLISASCGWVEKSERRRRTKRQSRQVPGQFVPLAEYPSVAANIPLSNDSGCDNGKDKRPGIAHDGMCNLEPSSLIFFGKIRG